MPLVLLAGCYEAMLPDADADVDADVLVPDAAVCPALAGYERCADDCSPRERDCPPDSYCTPQAGSLCLPITVGDDYRPNHCGQDSAENKDVACWSGQPCALFEAPPGDLGGRCVSEELCDAAREEGIAIDCRWSDGTPRVTGPPTLDECPMAPDDRLPFCGGPCGGCPLVEAPPTVAWTWDQSCVGLSDARAFGVCVLSEVACSPEMAASRAAGAPFESPDLAGSTYACLTFSDDSPDGLWPYGWTTLSASCLAYRARFPDVVDCMDDAWTALP